MALFLTFKLHPTQYSFLKCIQCIQMVNHYVAYMKLIDYIVYQLYFNNNNDKITEKA